MVDEMMLVLQMMVCVQYLCEKGKAYVTILIPITLATKLILSQRVTVSCSVAVL